MGWSRPSRFRSIIVIRCIRSHTHTHNATNGFCQGKRLHKSRENPPMAGYLVGSHNHALTLYSFGTIDRCRPRGSLGCVPDRHHHMKLACPHCQRVRGSTATCRASHLASLDSKPIHWSGLVYGSVNIQLRKSNTDC